VGCLLWRQNSPEVNYSPLGSLEGSVSRGSVVQQAKRVENRDLGPRIETGGGRL